MINLGQKIAKIESLESIVFSDLVINLLTKMEYSDIKKTGEHLSATINGPMSSDTHAFIIILEKLSGNVELEKFKELIAVERATTNFFTAFIVSPYHISNGFKENLRAEIKDIKLEFIGRDEMIEQIEKLIPDFWKHDDLELLDYEKHYCNSLLKESDLKKLKIFNEKYEKLLDIFIEPRIIHIYEDKETQTPVKRNISIDNIIIDKKPIILSGDAGTGKSTLLKKIGEIIIKQNQEFEKKNLPIFISVVDLFDSEFDIEKVIHEKLEPFFNADLTALTTDYNVTLLIDSIDEFEIENQKKITGKLNEIYEKDKIKFILGTRSSDKPISITELKNYPVYTITRFNNQQIQQFINKFFFNQESRAEKLIEALKENRIIEKLPITPLSLSLISILFEENDLEIPATITDIYENFNSLLLGRAVVSSRIEFIDISFKERILSLYAIELLKRKEHNPMTLDEFMLHFKIYFESKTLPIKKGTLEDVLNYLIENTGIIYLKNNKYVSFNHDSFMEFYAAIEIFKHQRDDERYFIDNFFDIHWQNSAVFYAGKSKDMPEFLKSINQKLKSAKYINDFFIGVNGAGYLLQALYQTDNKIRKETIDIALELNIQAHDFFMKMAADDGFLFKSFKLPIIWLMNLIYFYENFNSITLKDPLKLSYISLLERFRLNPTSTIDGYKALNVALTLSSKRINELGELEELVFSSPLLNNNILTVISEITLQVINGESYKELKKEVKKSFKKLKPETKKLLEIPASRLRFTSYDQIKSDKKIQIVTEGKTDSELLEHAFVVLSNGELPYWSIKPAGNESGGAREVFKALESANSTTIDDEIIIGIFDHDEAGISNFNGLSKGIFLPIKNNTVKKHKESNIYAILLPIPGEKQHYLNKEQKFNYFEIEHLFPQTLLVENDIIQKTQIPDIFSIKDSKKKEFSKIVRKLNSPQIFRDFIILFEEIDEITGLDIEYI